jgi:two-component system, OmpR family, response regulator
MNSQLVSAASLHPLARLKSPNPRQVAAPAQCQDTNRSTSARILIANDNGELRSNVADYLERQNMSVVGSLAGREEIVRQIEQFAPSLVLLYHTPQRSDGPGTLRDIRAKSDVPVIVITGIGTDEADRIVGLELGADDCVTVPFNRRELFARIRAVLRRNAIRQDGPGRGLNSVVYKFSGWQLHQGRHQLINPQGSEASLSKAEYALLIAFVAAPGRLLTREYLISAARVNSDIFDRSIDVLVHRLRRKLDLDRSAASMIETERGFGYRFCASVERVAFR